MGRPDKRDKQLKRARAELDVLLARGRLADAADALLTLPAEERERVAAILAARLADEHERLLRAREVTPLLAWRARCEREPRLLPSSPDELARARWCWLIAAIRTASWTRVGAIFAELENALAGWPLLPALRSLVAHQGHPEPSELESFAAELQRLGYDLPPKRIVHSRPTRAEDVEAACVTCLAVEPWARFRTIVHEWLGRAPDELSREIARMAATLSRRELVVQSASDPLGALEVARWCALWCIQGGQPPVLEHELTLCVRIAARSLQGTVTERRVVDACTPIVRAALGYPSLVEPVGELALSALYALPLADAAVQLLRPLVEHPDSPRAILKLSGILALQDEHAEETVPAPPWLLQAFERALESPDSLARALAESATHGPALYLLDALPLALSVRACVSLFPAADEGAREMLAQAAEDAAERMRERPVTTLTPSALRAMLEAFDPGFEEWSDAELRRLLASSDGKALQSDLRRARFALAASVPETWRAQLEQVAEPLMPYSVGLLDELLAFCRSPAEERVLATRFWSRRPGITARFDALVQANQRQADRALNVLERELLRNCKPEPDDAARALLKAERIVAPRSLRKKLAEALLGALSDESLEGVRPELAEALRAAKRLVKPRAPRSDGRGKRASQPAKSKPRARASKKAATQYQTELFSQEDSAT